MRRDGGIEPEIVAGHGIKKPMLDPQCGHLSISRLPSALFFCREITLNLSTEPQGRLEFMTRK